MISTSFPSALSQLARRSIVTLSKRPRSTLDRVAWSVPQVGLANCGQGVELCPHEPGDPVRHRGTGTAYRSGLGIDAADVAG